MLAQSIASIAFSGGGKSSSHVMKLGTNYLCLKQQCKCAPSQLHPRSRDPAATQFLSEKISKPSMSLWAAMVPAAVFESRRSRSSERQGVTKSGVA